MVVAILDHAYKLHGMPQTIITGRHKIFTSHFWQELFALTNTQLSMSSSYHPQTDGQSERVNQCLETYLCCSAHSCPSRWKQWLSVDEFWYNASYTLLLTRHLLKFCMGSPLSTWALILWSLVLFLI